jgi:hypothetical protein
MLRSQSFDGQMRTTQNRRELKENTVDVFDGQADAVKDELRELKERVNKWLQESSRPPASTATFTDEEFRHEKREKYEKISEKRRHSMSDMQTSKCCTLEERSGPMTLYHPDFADWRSCEITPNVDSFPRRNNSPILLNILDEAHSALSKLFKFDA